MKANILILLFICLFSSNTIAQSQKNKNFIKQQQNMPATRPKIHANSNSVFGTGNTHPKYIKKDQTTEVKKEGVKDNDRIKANNNKPKKEK